MNLLSLGTALLLGTSLFFAQKEPVDYVNPLMGTDSKISLSNGNTYPAIALPWGNEFLDASDRQDGDGWPIPTLRIKSVASSKPTSPVPGSMITASFQLCR